MKIMPPFEVPFAIVSHFPELLLLESAAQQILHQHIKNAQNLSNLRETVQQQGAPGKNCGWAHLEDIILQNTKPAVDKEGKPIYRLKLSDRTIQALPVLLAQVLRAAMQDPQLKNRCWSVQDGVVPGEESGGSAARNWTLKTLAPRNGLAIPQVDFNDGEISFRLAFENAIPRHLGLYCQFLKNKVLLEPAGWQSRLSWDVPDIFETKSVKYLGELAPNVPVAGLPLATEAQVVDLALPAQADSCIITAGGVGNGKWQALEDAAGVMLTFVLDYAVPAIMMNAGAGLENATWFQHLLGSEDMRNEIIAGGEFILSDPRIRDTSTLLAVLSDKIAALMLDQSLKHLRHAINKNVGSQAVENAAPMLGWGPQTLKALLDTQNSADNCLAQATSRLLSIPATFSIALSPAMLFDLQVNLEPDAARGEWPDDALTYQASIEYEGGFTQRQSGRIPQNPPAAPLSATFGSVPSGGTINIQISLNSQDDRACARGSATFDAQPVATKRLLEASVALADEPVVITAATRYLHKRKLSYDASSGQYAWEPGEPPTAVKDRIDSIHSTQAGLCGLVDITLQESARCIGYTWRVAGAGLRECGGPQGPIGMAYLFQNIGTVNPNTALKSIDCGFVEQPYLVYEDTAASVTDKANQGVSHNFYLDPRDSWCCLREVVLDSETPFNLTDKKCRGRFREHDLNGIGIHPMGFAVAVCRQNNKLEILKLSDTPVDDDTAPRSLLLAGAGTREGLLNSPVGLAIASNGRILVLENGDSGSHARVQAFDPYGNPVPCFNQSPFMALEAESGVEYQDIAVSPTGLIYVLSNVNGGQNPRDYRLEIYEPDGRFLNRTEGICAARIDVDSRGRVYTLNYESITGPRGRPEPSISEWIQTIGNS